MIIHAKIAQSDSLLVPIVAQRMSVANMVARHGKPRSKESIKTAESMIGRSVSASTRNIERGVKMPRHKIIYDEDLKNTPEFQALYSKWKAMRNHQFPLSEAFEEFLTFYNWSMANGFASGARLVRVDDRKPYGPDSCVWVQPKKMQHEWTTEEKAWIAKWNKTVNRLRRYFGIETFDYEGDA